MFSVKKQSREDTRLHVKKKIRNSGPLLSEEILNCQPRIFQKNLYFDGACTAGDGSCDLASLSMGAGFCDLKSSKWLEVEPITPTRSHEQRTRQSHKVGREGGKDWAPIAQNWSLSGNVYRPIQSTRTYYTSLTARPPFRL